MSLGIISLLGLHLLLTVVVWFLFKKKTFPFPAYYATFIFCLPFVGVLFLWVSHLGSESRKTYQPFMEPDPLLNTPSETVLGHIKEDLSYLMPLEDALLLGESEVARKLLLDILREDPEDFLDLLRLSRLNEDTEVVHYATTAIAELVRRNDLLLSEAELAYSENPENPQVLAYYCQVLDHYLNLGLVNDHIEIDLRLRYQNALLELLTSEPSLEVYLSLVKNRLFLQDFSQVENDLAHMNKVWPDSEEVWLLQLRYAVETRQPERLRWVLETIQTGRVYISAENRSQFDFWMTN